MEYVPVEKTQEVVNYKEVKRSIIHYPNQEGEQLKAGVSYVPSIQPSIYGGYPGYVQNPALSYSPIKSNYLNVNPGNYLKSNVNPNMKFSVRNPDPVQTNQARFE